MLSVRHGCASKQVRDWPGSGVFAESGPVCVTTCTPTQCDVLVCTQVRDWPESGMSLEERLSFFRETRHAFGRTALLLSGGGGLGTFHLVGGGTCAVNYSLEWGFGMQYSAWSGG